MGIREQLISQGGTSATSVGTLVQKAKDSAPAIARVDDDYGVADIARLFNRFNRDTVESLGAITEALGALESRVSALEGQE